MSYLHGTQDRSRRMSYLHSTQGCRRSMSYLHVRGRSRHIAYLRRRPGCSRRMAYLQCRTWPFTAYRVSALVYGIIHDAWRICDVVRAAHGACRTCTGVQGHPRHMSYLHVRGRLRQSNFRGCPGAVLRSKLLVHAVRTRNAYLKNKMLMAETWVSFAQNLT